MWRTCLKSLGCISGNVKDILEGLLELWTYRSLAPLCWLDILKGNLGWLPIRYTRGKPGMTTIILNFFFFGISLLELWIYHSTAQLCWLDVLEGKRSKTQQILTSRYLYYMGSIWKKKNMKVVKDRTKTKKEKATHLGKESGPKLRNAFQVWGRRERGGGKGGGGCWGDWKTDKQDQKQKIRFQGLRICIIQVSHILNIKEKLNTKNGH